MQNLFQIHHANKSYGSKVLFQDASLSVNQGEHVGVIGPNGAGKTTLFKVLAGQENLDSGEFIQTNGMRIGFLEQHDHFQDETVEEYLLHGTTLPIWDLKSLGRSLGLLDAVYSKKILSLSGGYRMRCKLLQLLGKEPDLLLLDEPTNYLDLESLLALEGFLQNYRKSFLLISHDREFLRRTTDHIVEVEGGEITKYPGSLDDYFEQKALLRQQLESRALSLEQKKKEILDFVARFGAKATKASQAQSRLKQLEKMEVIEVKSLPVTARIRLPAPLPTGKSVFSFRDVSLGYADYIVLKNVQVQIQRGDRVAVVGVNGAGKSTFLKALAGSLAPLQGEITFGHQVSLSYYAQHVAEALDLNATVLDEIAAKAATDVDRQQVLDMAGSLLFSGDDVHKKISVLSGGERSRVALGQVLLQKAPCLVLDEPTNHLDFQTVEALTQALMEYTGTVVVVSHDRGFIRRIATRILEVRDGKIENYPGTYDEYVWSCQQGAFSNRASVASNGSQNAKKDEVASSRNSYEERKQLERDLKKAQKDSKNLEDEITVLSSRVEQFNQKLAESPTDPAVQSWIQEMTSAQSKINDLEQKWFEIEEKRLMLGEKLSGNKNE